MTNQGETDTDGEALADSAKAAYGSIKEGGEAMRDTAAAQGEALEDEAEDYLLEGGESFNAMVNRAEFAIIDHPLAAVGIAFAAGWLSGKLFR